jgi:hypothetical protein
VGNSLFLNDRVPTNFTFSGVLLRPSLLIVFSDIKFDSNHNEVRGCCLMRKFAIGLIEEFNRFIGTGPQFCLIRIG